MAENTENSQAFLVLEDHGVNRVVLERMLKKLVREGDPIGILKGSDLETDFTAAQAVVSACRGRIAMILDNQTPNGGALAFLKKIVDGIRGNLLETVDRTLVVFPHTNDTAAVVADMRTRISELCAAYPDTLKLGDNLGKPISEDTLRTILLSAGFELPQQADMDDQSVYGGSDDGPPTYTGDMSAEAAVDKIEKALPILISQLEALSASPLTRVQKRAELRKILNEIIDLWDSASSKLPQEGDGRLIKIMFHTVKGYASEIRQSVAAIREIDDIATNLIDILEAAKYKAPNAEVTLSSPIPAFDRLHTYYAENKQVRFISMPTELPATAIDPWHLQIAVMNLIHNAQVAGADSVEVYITQQGNNIKVTVSDNGRPFPADWTPEQALQGEGGRTGNGLRDIEFLGMNLDFAEYRGKAGIGELLKRLWLQWKGAPYEKAISILIPTEAQNGLVKA